MKTPWKVVAALLVAVFVLAACGGDDDGGGGDNGGGETGGTDVEAVSAEEYVTSICTSMQTYVSDVQTMSTDFAAGVDPTAGLADQKAALVGFLDDVIASTDALITDLEAAGVPDVDGGEDVVATLEAAFADARTVLEDAKAQVEALGEDDPAAFATELSEIGTTIQESLGSIGTALSELNSPDLDAAAAEVPACSQIAA